MAYPVHSYATALAARNQIAQDQLAYRFRMRRARLDIMQEAERVLGRAVSWPSVIREIAEAAAADPTNVALDELKDRRDQRIGEIRLNARLLAEIRPQWQQVQDFVAAQAALESGGDRKWRQCKAEIDHCLDVDWEAERARVHQVRDEAEAELTKAG